MGDEDLKNSDGSRCVPWEQTYGDVQITDAEKFKAGCDVVAGINSDKIHLFTDGGFPVPESMYGNYNGNNRQTEFNPCVAAACLVEQQFVYDLVNWLHDPSHEND